MNTNVVNDMMDDLLHARAQGTPLVVYETTDSFAFQERFGTKVNGRPVMEMDGEAEVPVPGEWVVPPNEKFKDNCLFSWNFANGLEAMNEAADEWIGELMQNVPALAKAGAVAPRNPVALIDFMLQMPRWSAVVAHNFNDLLHARMQSIEEALPLTIAAARDDFKENGTMLLMCDTHFDVPRCMENSVFIMDEPLPDEAATRQIVLDVCEMASVQPEPKMVHMATQAAIGMDAFAIEQNVSFACRNGAINIDALWDQKKHQIEQTPGLTMWRDGASLSDLYGMKTFKGYIDDFMEGPDPPNLIVWIEELDKVSMSNASGGEDSSGTNSDQKGQILTYMEDHDVYGMILLGPPGSGKSGSARAIGPTYGRPTLRADFGGTKNKYVGDSEANIRKLFKVITAIGNDKALFIATANSVEGMDDALLRRFTDIWFFDMPDDKCREGIWPIWMNKCRLDPKAKGNDWKKINTTGWAGSDIKKACEKAMRLRNGTIDRGAKFTIPVGIKSAETIKTLRKEAHGRYQSAEYEGPYVNPDMEEEKPKRSPRKRAVK